MTILDELERLHKLASVYFFLNPSLEDTVWVDFIVGCQKHLPALIEIARAADDYYMARAWASDGEVKDRLREALEKLK